LQIFAVKSQTTKLFWSVLCLLVLIPRKTEGIDLNFANFVVTLLAEADAALVRPVWSLDPDRPNDRATVESLVTGAALQRFSRMWSQNGDVWKVEFEILGSEKQGTQGISPSPQPTGAVQPTSVSSGNPRPMPTTTLTSIRGEIQLTSVNLQFLRHETTSAEQGTISISGLGIYLIDRSEASSAAKPESLGLARQFQDLTWVYRFRLAKDKVTLQNEAFLNDGPDEKQLIRFLAWHYAVPLERVRLVNARANVSPAEPSPE
jgi:hypothetical protein